MSGKTLFIGNGLNRATKNGVAWADLMRELGAVSAPEAGIPFPIEFEAIMAKQGTLPGHRKEDAYKANRKKLSEIIEKKFQEPPGDILWRYKSLPFNSLITTNYDETFESMYFSGKPDSCIKKVGSTRNVLCACFVAEDVSFYHAHGLARWANTMCLSHDHYASLISKIDKALCPQGEDGASYASSVLQTIGSLEEAIWPALLFTDDIAIVGFGFDYSEMDLWRLLSVRAAAYAVDRRLDGNQVVYYEVVINSEQGDRKDNLRTNGKLAVLEALGVETVQVPAATYLDGYREIADRIEKQWSE